MAIVVILVLGILWAIVLLPPILRARAESGGSGVSGGMGELLSMFSSKVGRGHGGESGLPPVQSLMGPVGPMGAGGGMGPVGATRVTGAMTSAQKRRRDILVGLLCAAGITLVMAVFSSGSPIFYGINLVCDVALGGYIYMLVQLKTRQQQVRPRTQSYEPAGRRLRSVPPLPETSTGGEPAFALRRSASY